MDTTLTTTARVDAFFDDLTNRGHLDALNHINGTVEFDIGTTERRWLTVREGDVHVSHTPISADCVVACDTETFISIVSGRMNVVAASIRGSVTISGDIALALAMLRLGTDGNGRQ